MYRLKDVKLKVWTPIGRELEREIRENTTYGDVSVIRYGDDLLGIEKGAYPITFNINTKSFLIWDSAVKVDYWEYTEENYMQLKMIALEWLSRHEEDFNF